MNLVQLTRDEFRNSSFAERVFFSTLGFMSTFLGAKCLAQEVEPPQKEPQAIVSPAQNSSTLYGRLRDGMTDLPIAEGYVFAVDPETREVLGYSTTMPGRGSSSGFWKIDGLPYSQDVVLIGFHPKIKSSLAAQNVTIGTKFQEVSGLDTNTSLPQTVSGFDYASLIGTIAGKINKVVGDKDGEETAEALLANVGGKDEIEGFGAIKISEEDHTVFNSLLGTRVFPKMRETCGRYPTTEEGYRAFFIDPETMSGWSGPYIKPQDGRSLFPVDEFGRLFVLEGDGKKVRVYAKGKDGRAGTNDDIEVFSLGDWDEEGTEMKNKSRKGLGTRDKKENNPSLGSTSKNIKMENLYALVLGNDGEERGSFDFSRKRFVGKGGDVEVKFSNGTPMLFVTNPDMDITYLDRTVVDTHLEKVGIDVNGESEYFDGVFRTYWANLNPGERTTPLVEGGFYILAEGSLETRFDYFGLVIGDIDLSGGSCSTEWKVIDPRSLLKHKTSDRSSPGEAFLSYAYAVIHGDYDELIKTMGWSEDEERRKIFEKTGNVCIRREGDFEGVEKRDLPLFLDSGYTMVNDNTAAFFRRSGGVGLRYLGFEKDEKGSWDMREFCLGPGDSKK